MRPARMDSNGKPGIGDGPIDVVALVFVEVVAVVLTVEVPVTVVTVVVVEVVVPGTLSGP
jgi:hypothetical protein